MAGLEGLLAGRVLGGRYLIEEVIGRGGMGVVYRALDERLGRRVALKVITLVGGDPEAVERLRARFHREARAAAALPHHPNVVAVYDYGTDDDLGLDYIVMELLRGQDLASRMADAEPLPLATGLRILVQAVRGVAVGHRAGLIHRDVKPGNVFLVEGEEREVQVRVVDFGIAKVVDDDDTTNQLTLDGRVPHSPAFASPEQLRGLSRITPASDVFSLGAVGFLLLTGHRPFDESDRNRMMLGMPVRPPSIRKTHPAVPAAVEAVLLKALAFDPRDRFPDAVAMLNALEEGIRSLSGTPVEPYLPLSAVPPRQPWFDERTEWDDDDQTQLLQPAAISSDEVDERTQLLEEEHTLAAPPPAVEPTAAGAAPPRAFPPRPPLHQKPRRRRWGLIVWPAVLLALGAVAFWAVQEANRPFAGGEIPPPPEEIRGIGEEMSVDVPTGPDLTDAIIPNLEGIEQHRRGQFDSAAVNFRIAVQVDEASAVYRRNLALALLELGEANEAVDHLRRAVDLDPTFLLAQYDLGRALLAVGDTTGSLEWLGNFVDRSSNDRDLVSARIAAISAIRRIRSAQAAARIQDESASPAEDPVLDSAAMPDLPELPEPDVVVPVVPADGND